MSHLDREPKPSISSTKMESSPDEPREIDAMIEALFSPLGPQRIQKLVDTKRAALEVLKEETERSSLAEQAVLQEYNLICEQIASGFDISPEAMETYAKVQIAFDVYKASILYEAGFIDSYIYQLSMAETHAFNRGFDNIATTLRTELHTIINASELTIEGVLFRLKYVLSEDELTYLRSLLKAEDGIEDCINAAYKLLEREEGNPDEVLATVKLTRRETNS